MGAVQKDWIWVYLSRHLNRAHATLTELNDAEGEILRDVPHQSPRNPDNPASLWRPEPATTDLSPHTTTDESGCHR